MATTMSSVAGQARTLRVAALITAGMILCTVASQRAVAADVLYLLTHGYQDALVVGTVVDATADLLILDPIHTIAGVPTKAPAELALNNPGAEGAAQSFGPGTIVVASVSGSGSNLTEKWGVFVASSSDPTTLEIVSGPLNTAEIAAFQQYLNSGGKASNFGMADDTLQPEEAEVGRTTSGWDLSYLAGAAGVLVLIVVLLRFRPQPPERRGR